MRLQSFYGDELPPYAILSHTWGPEEVDMQEFQRFKPEIHHSEGYGKIKRFCEQAMMAGFEHAWVDTCCIDKSSSSELSEAINSMFRWYQRASLCYVYLADVSSGVPESEMVDLFESSRWFTRGWTLQELLAPQKVNFYSKEWVLIGNREIWRINIALVTGMHEKVLSGDYDTIRSFGIAQKMSWASKRTTTRAEDSVYCLLGLFDVNMPLLYGEGKLKAFWRLQEEIMKDSDDQSIFAWDGNSSHNLCGFLAPYPSAFNKSSHIIPMKSWTASQPYFMTNAGLKIDGLIHHLSRDGQKVFLLRCLRENEPECAIGVLVTPLSSGGDQFARLEGHLVSVPVSSIKSESLRTIYIRKELLQPEQQFVRRTAETLSFRVSTSLDGHILLSVYPKNQWNQKDNTIYPPAELHTNFNTWGWSVALLLAGPVPGSNFHSTFVLALCYNAATDRLSYMLSDECNDLNNLADLDDSWREKWFRPTHGVRSNTFVALPGWDNMTGVSKQEPDFKSEFRLYQNGYTYAVDIDLRDEGKSIRTDKLSTQWTGKPLEVLIKRRSRGSPVKANNWKSSVFTIG
jgi:Heterokaryon incompatibility protein (HET)